MHRSRDRHVSVDGHDRACGLGPTERLLANGDLPGVGVRVETPYADASNVGTVGPAASQVGVDRKVQLSAPAF